MNGPTNIRDTLDGISTGLGLTATSKGENIVELTHTKTQSVNTQEIPKNGKLFAPLLWAEIEDTNCDRTLISKYDYIIPLRDFQVRMLINKKSAQERASSITVTIELSVDDIPKNASLYWTHNNHAKPLAGSLPESKYTVRILSPHTPDTIVISNPITVSGKNNVNPANLMRLGKPPYYIPVNPTPPPAQKIASN